MATRVEIWKTTSVSSDIEVSNLGNVRRKEQHINIGDKISIFPPQLLKPFQYGRYLCVNFNNKTYSIHRLVAEAFIPNPENLPTVVHKDNNTFHNEATNLQWSTRSDNMKNCRNSESYRKSSGRSIKILCVSSGVQYSNIKSVVEELRKQNIDVNYDTFLRHIKKNGSFEVNNIKFTKILDD